MQSRQNNEIGRSPIKGSWNALLMQTRKPPLIIITSTTRMKIVAIIKPAASGAVGDIYEYWRKFFLALRRLGNVLNTACSGKSKLKFSSTKHPSSLRNSIVYCLKRWYLDPKNFKYIFDYLIFLTLDFGGLEDLGVACFNYNYFLTTSCEGSSNPSLLLSSSVVG